MLIAAFELALPALAALFAAEVVLGIAARFAPQANVFLVGLPLKIITALGTVWLVVLLVPETFSGTLRVIEQSFIDVIDVLGGEGRGRGIDDRPRRGDGNPSTAGPSCR